MSFLRTGAIAVLVAVISMVGPAVPRAQSSISILEVRAQAFIAAFNSGDPETYEAFRKKHRVPENPPDKDWREEYLGLYERWGKLELHDIMIEDEFTIVVRAAAERSPGSVRLTFALETAEPHRIESLTLALESSDDGPPEIDLPDLEIDSSMDAKTLTKKLDGYLEKLAKDDIYSGVTLIVRDGK